LKLTLAVERKRSFLLQRTKLNVARFYVWNHRSTLKFSFPKFMFYLRPITILFVTMVRSWRKEKVFFDRKYFL
jgi:hypothetical protein